MKRVKVIEQGIGYRIYVKDKIFFLETSNRKEAIGFDTFENACESAYYQGYRKGKAK